jgi:hypothetical protein
MKILEGIGAAASAVLVVLALLFTRRTLIERGRGTIELSLRLSTMVPGRGWASGIGRFVDEELRWYRVFSFAWRPRRVLSRRALAVEGRRKPSGPEALALPPDWVIVRCISGGQGPIEIAMAQPTLTGFLSWVEAAPPGAASMRFAAR